MQSGGSFDVDFSVTGPGEKLIMDGTKERQGDFVFTAQSVGEYKFCFDNEMSTFAEKMVDFEIAVRVSVLVFPSSDTWLFGLVLISLSLNLTGRVLVLTPFYFKFFGTGRK